MAKVFLTAIQRKNATKVLPTVKPSLRILAALLFTPLAVPHLHGAPNSDFDQKAAKLYRSWQIEEANPPSRKEAFVKADERRRLWPWVWGQTQGSGPNGPLPARDLIATVPPAGCRLGPHGSTTVVRR